MKYKLGIYGVVSIAIVTAFLLFNSIESNANPSSGDMAIIVVSDYNGYDSTEMGKAIAFYDYLIDSGLSSSNIEFLIDDGITGQDGEGNLSNFENALDDLVDDTNMKDIYIYISDNGHAIQNDAEFQFEDGGISRSTIEDNLDDMTYSSLTFITLGNRSGLFGSDLLDTDRVIISSQAPYQEINPDLFNITRSLENSANDSNNDGIVDFVEAFNAEENLLIINPQDPEIWTM